MKQTKRFLILLTLASTLLLSSCGPSVKTTGSWVNKEKLPAQPYKSVFIVALTANLEAKTTLELDLQSAAEARGLKAYKSIDEFGPVASLESLPVKDALLRKIRELGCEAIFTVALVDKQSETRYVPGNSTIYTPYTMYGGYYGTFGGYYAYGASTMYTPGYYTTDKTYFIESNVFDAKTEDIMMSVQSKAENPSSIEKGSKEYMATIVYELDKVRASRK